MHAMRAPQARRPLRAMAALRRPPPRPPRRQPLRRLLRRLRRRLELACATMIASPQSETRRHGAAFPPRRRRAVRVGRLGFQCPGKSGWVGTARCGWTALILWRHLALPSRAPQIPTSQATLSAGSGERLAPAVFPRGSTGFAATCIRSLSKLCGRHWELWAAHPPRQTERSQGSAGRCPAVRVGNAYHAPRGGATSTLYRGFQGRAWPRAWARRRATCSGLSAQHMWRRGIWHSHRGARYR